MNQSEISDIIAENARRVSDAAAAGYDPLVGCPGHPWRVATRVPWELSTVYLPESMLRDPHYSGISCRLDYQRLRCIHDFEYWAAVCVPIYHKISCREVPFVLNSPQRVTLDELERQRRAGLPIRLILLKARQWGGSTLIQVYMAWIQILHRRHWNSIICSHVRNTSGALRSTIRRILRNYPPELWPFDDIRPSLSPWESMPATRIISGTESTVTITSTVAQDSIRGLPFSMAHLSEVAFWKDSDFLSPQEFTQSITGGIALTPYSLIVMESTANGSGNFFHSQWTAALSGHSPFAPVFVPWYTIEMYTLPCPDPHEFISRWTHRELHLWGLGLTVDQIYWYSMKAREFTSPEAFHAEYPTTAEEAFTATNYSVFDTASVERLRSRCQSPIDFDAACMRRPILRRLTPLISRDATLQLWDIPPADAAHCSRERFLVSVDVGGRSLSSDYSVITVFDRLGCAPGIVARVVAQWRGHTDHDILARYAETLARLYGDALLIVESNSLETASDTSSQYILEQLNDSYHNLYVRRSRDQARGSSFDTRVGFHTNRATKSASIANLIRLVRDGLYQENSPDALNEMLTYQVTPSGAYSAKRGFHDDILITRAIALYVLADLPPLTSEKDR